MATQADAASEHALKILTPSRLAMACSVKLTGLEWVPHPWVLHAEREVLAMLQRPGREVMIVNLPPQEGKTTYFGMWLLAWYLGLNPSDLVIFVAYNSDYSATWGVKVRGFFEQLGMEMFGVGLNKSQQSQNSWRTTKGYGGMLAAGIDGGITGNPGHFIVIDDVIKNMGEALSAATKAMHLQEWDGSISARFQNNTKVLITATRWAEDDLSGEIENRSKQPGYEGIKVTRLNFKAIAEPDEIEMQELQNVDEDDPRTVAEKLDSWRDVLGRRMGEPLQGQHTPDFFRERKASIAPRVWGCLYQGSPTMLEGSMFPRTAWRFFDPENRPRMISKKRVWDLAATDNDGDWTAGALVGKDTDGNFYVLDMQHLRKAGDKVQERVEEVARDDGWGIPIRIEEERNGAGKSLIALYKRDLEGRDLQAVKAEGQKIDRFQPYSNKQNAGKVYLPRFADGTSPEWVPGFIEEHRQQMQTGIGPRHDDRIDAVAHAVIDMMDETESEFADPAAIIGNPNAAAELAERLGYGDPSVNLMASAR
jgi:predicted phage terminase large subunit-like protein